MPGEKITAKLYDSHHRHKADYKGEIRNGVFYYKIHTLLGYGGEEKQEKVEDYKRIFELDEKHRYLLYETDGINWKQIGIEDTKDAKEGKGLSEYMASTENAILQKEVGLKKKFGLRDLINFLEIIILIISVVAVYFVSSHANSVIQQDVAPFNKSIQLNAIQNQQLHNLTLVMLRTCNATYNYLSKTGLGLPSG